MIFRQKNYLPIFLLAFLVALFFSPFIFSGHIPYAGDFTGSDMTELNLPLRFLSFEAIKNGHLPLWTDLLANGFPILAEGQTGVFYPLNLIYLILPFVLAVNISFLLNTFFAGFFTYLYCRVLKISWAGALFSALAFSFSGFFIFRIKHINMINGAIWLPLIFYLIEKYFSSKKKIPIIVLLAVVFAVQFLAGHPQISYISVISSFIYFLLKSFSVSENNESKVSILKIFLPWIGIGVITLGLVSAQLIPTFVNSSLSHRGTSIGFQEASISAYDFFKLTYFVSPYFFGNPADGSFDLDINKSGIFWEDNIYFGLITLLLFIVGLLFVLKKNRHVKINSILILIFFFIILGYSNKFLFSIFQFIPGFKMFRFHQRFLLTILLSMTVIAGFGFDYIWSRIKGLKILESSKILSKVLFPVLLILILMVDLYLSAYKYVGSLDYDKYFGKPDSVEFLQQDKGVYRVYSFNWPDVWQSVYQFSGGWQNNMNLFVSGRELLPPDLNFMWGVSSAQDRGFLEGGMLIEENHYFSYYLDFYGFKVDDDKNAMAVSDEVLDLMSVRNIKYILSFTDIYSENLEKVSDFTYDFLPTLKIYENKKYLPPAFAVFDVESFSDKKAVFEKMLDSNFDPSSQIILDSSIGSVESQVDKSHGDVLSFQQGFNKKEIAVDFEGEGFLYLSQTYYPGWQVLIDDKPAELLRANYAFSAVKIPPGEHLVKLKFLPPFYVAGFAISLVSLFLIIIYLIIYFYTNKKALMIDRNKLDEIHKNVPPDYYEKGIEKNLLQRYWHKKSYKLAANEIAKLNITGKIFDLGCHSGDFTNEIYKKNKVEFTALDISQQAIDYGKKRFPHINFVYGDFSAGVDFADNFFEAVISFDVLEHIPNTSKILDEIRRITSNSGYLVIGVPNENLLFRSVWAIWTRLKGQVWEDTHVNHFDERSFKMFEEKGFKIKVHKKIICGMWRFMIFKLEK